MAEKCDIFVWGYLCSLKCLSELQLEIAVTGRVLSSDNHVKKSNKAIIEALRGLNPLISHQWQKNEAKISVLSLLTDQWAQLPR